MRKFVICLMILMSLKSFSQYKASSGEEKAIMSVGLLQGGGSLVGADLELKLANHLGAQIGAGLLGYGAGIDFHFKPDIRSSSLSLQYWHQGISPYAYQSWAGPLYVYRAPRWFTASIGLGLNTGGNLLPTSTPVTLLFSIGGYFPL
jgi:hypothetical protein